MMKIILNFKFILFGTLLSCIIFKQQVEAKPLVIKLERNAPGVGLEQIALKVEFKQEKIPAIYKIDEILKKITLSKNTNYFFNSSTLGKLDVKKLSNKDKIILSQLISIHRGSQGAIKYRDLDPEIKKIAKKFKKNTSIAHPHKSKVIVNGKTIRERNKWRKEIISLFKSIVGSKALECIDCLKVKSNRFIKIKDSKMTRVKPPCKKNLSNNKLCMTSYGSIYR